ncbi:F0F1 ATP synthase subunit A [Patescibacteria group bacterium]|nr:F0F1 ATP synthase subunit A [Patescibacteria group bacterium]
MLAALPPLAAEPIFNIGTFSVTNTYINSTLTVLLFAVLAFFISRKVKDVPGKLQNLFEWVTEMMLMYFDQVTGSRKKSEKFLPLIGALFLYIVISNWISLLPGIGSIGLYRAGEFIPFFRPANTDLNTTLSMAVFGVILAHIIGVFSIGFFKYFNKFIKISDIWHAVKSKKAMNIMTAAIEFMVGFLEIISEAAKILSLSLRLFGNIFAGEVLLTVLGSIVAYLVPTPFMGLEFLVGIVQAAVFAMLVLTYITVATMPDPEHAKESKHGHESHASEQPAV